MKEILKLVSATALVGCIAAACSAGEADSVSDSEADGGSAPETDVTATGGNGSTGGTGGTTEEITHPLFGAGNYTGFSSDDPCEAAWEWEEGNNIPFPTGFQVKYEGIVYEVTGTGFDESTWTDEWIAPPCDREEDRCTVNLAYEVVADCNEAG